ncbi:hypothetical protein GCM10010388_23210 [Streptomyces mauvecolor]
MSKMAHFEVPSIQLLQCPNWWLLSKARHFCEWGVWLHGERVNWVTCGVVGVRVRQGHFGWSESELRASGGVAAGCGFKWIYIPDRAL